MGNNGINIKRIGMVGVGRMGGPMARRLLAAGYELVISDTNQSAVDPLVAMGAKSVASPKAVADEVEVVLMSLPMPDVVSLVSIGANGLVHGSAVKVVVDLSTTGPRTVSKIAKDLKDKAMTMIDSPVSGGVAGATKGTLAVMVSGDLDTYNQIKPILENIGKLFYVGEEPGMGQTMKIINNLISVTGLAITSEAMVMGAKAGLDADAMIDVINAGSGRNSASSDKFPNFVLPRTFDFGFAIGLSAKDVKLCLEEGTAMGVPMPIGQSVVDFVTRVRDTYGEGADMTEMVKAIEDVVGVQVRGKAAKN
jgi:3-hydroxyisobutyrate dehydrogenase-like beta-hydroxyacid dehydrogenase